MADPQPPRAVVVRHGETAWSASGRHTGATDVGLTDEGRALARTLGATLAGGRFALVLTSPLRRARDTAVLAGLPGRGGRARPRGVGLRRLRGPDDAPDPPDGARLGGVDAPRAGRRDGRAGRGPRRPRGRPHRAGGRRRAVFSHGHFLRVLAARWVEEARGLRRPPAARHGVPRRARARAGAPGPGALERAAGARVGVARAPAAKGRLADRDAGLDRDADRPGDLRERRPGALRERVEVLLDRTPVPEIVSSAPRTTSERRTTAG